MIVLKSLKLNHKLAYIFVIFFHGGCVCIFVKYPLQGLLLVLGSSYLAVTPLSSSFNISLILAVLQTFLAVLYLRQ